MVELVTKSVTQVLISFTHSWPYLLLSVLVASVLKVHVEPARLHAVISGYVFDALLAGRLF